VKYGFIREQASKYQVRLMCEVLNVSRSGYYGWLRRPASARAKSDESLLVHIREIFHEYRRTYGYPRVHK